MGGGSGGGASAKLKKAAKKLFLPTCGGYFCLRQQNQNHVLDTVSCDPPKCSSPPENLKKIIPCEKISPENECNNGNLSNTPSSNKNLCPICLEPFNYVSDTSPGQAIFTAQCSHAFHFSCISSNVRHGSITCPVCRAHWTQLPRNLNPRTSLNYNKADPVLQILDDSIAHSRFHRRSFLRSARYDDDDPIDPGLSSFERPRLNFSLSNNMHSGSMVCPHRDFDSDSDHGSFGSTSSNARTYLNVKLSHQPPIDLVLVASPNGPHLRLMKQAMALAVFSLKPIDRLAIVTYSSSASRVFPLRRMNSYGKRTALQVIDRLFYTGHADPIEGLKKGVKILEDRLHKNPKSCILHLTDNPSRSYCPFDTEVPVSIQRFNVSYGFGAPNGFVMHEFEEFLVRMLGGVLRNVQLRIGDGMGVLGIGELRGGEERNIPLCLDRLGLIRVGYNYVDDGDEERVRTGEIVVGFEETGEDVRSEGVDSLSSMCGRISGAETWDYHDTFMARRWAKRLNGWL